MNKRDFLRAVCSGSAAVAAHAFMHTLLRAGNNPPQRKNWAWVATDVATSEEEWKRRFALMRQSGIDAVLPEVYDGTKAYYGSGHLPVGERWLEQLLPLASAEGLEVHAWMWSMPCNIEEVRRQHPEWFMVNRKGESAAEKPAYVDYYRFLCPSRPEVHEFIQATVSELASYADLAGIHLDYIRYPDVILPEALQPKYHIKQDREYPEYDYCYCDLCVEEFRKSTGVEIRKVEEPSQNALWRQFRYDRITHLVNDTIIPVVHQQGKIVTAAVFPNWDMVRQEWPVWNLDGVLPMLYHSLYGEGIGWIRKETERGVSSLRNRRPLYSGLLVFRMSPDDVAEAVEAAYDGGASGVAIFNAQGMTDAQWKSFRQAVNR